MNTKNKSIYEILRGREERVNIIKKLNEDNTQTVICFTVNSPGPYKLSDNYRFIFGEGVLALENIFNAKTLEKVERPSGFEAYFLIDKSPSSIKKATVKLEENHPLGRLFDIDIFYKDLSKISREDVGKPKRKCLLCNNNAVECGRARKHSVQELEVFINNLISEYKRNM